MRLPIAALLMAGLVATGCSTIDKLNPFSSSIPKAKPAELSQFQPTATLAVRWQAGVGKAGDYSFTPAVVGGSVYAAGQDGTIARIDNGNTVWRISAGATISGGVGSNGKIVVVGTPKADVLAFDTATGAALWRARAGSADCAARPRASPRPRRACPRWGWRGFAGSRTCGQPPWPCCWPCRPSPCPHPPRRRRPRSRPERRSRT